MIKMNWIYRITLTTCSILFGSSCYSQNTNITNLLNESQWDSLFPKRAGTFGIHPQGYKSDFYSFQNLKKAAEEMSDYKVQIKIKKGVWGQLITVTKKSSNITYNYSDVDPSWQTNSTTETIITVDFNDFLNMNSEQNNKRELGAFLANISKETTGGWQLPIGGGSNGDYGKWGLYFVHEVGYTNANAAGAYSQSNSEYPPNPAVGYYGRGPIQLSWNYNYGQLSKFLFNNKNILLNNPDTIQQDGSMAFKSAIWFWMMPQCPKPSCHQVMHDLWAPAKGEYSANKMYKMGFAHTNNIINGGLECRSTSAPAFTAKVALRSELYKYYLTFLGFNSTQISMENTGDYSTICYTSDTAAMQDYGSCFIIPTLKNSEIESHNLSVYPNPASNIISMHYDKPIAKVEIVNPLGEIIRVTKHQSSQIEFDISDLRTGVYTLKTYSGDKIFSKTFIKNN